MEKFDLAFGATPQIFAFAQSFTDRKTLTWLDWEDWMLTAEDGSIIRIMNANIFRGSLAAILTRYYTRIGDGLLKFNLQSLDAAHPDSVTTWELETLLRDYRAKTRFYLFDKKPVELVGEALSQQLEAILG